MICDACHANPSTVHLTEIVNKKKHELHLCEDCARAKGVCVQAEFAASLAPQPLVKVTPNPMVQSSPTFRGVDLGGLSCPRCGITFAQFKSSGRLGCANDYEVFRPGVVLLLEKIHGKHDHKGRVPAALMGRLDRQRQVSELRQELNRAIQAEEYERAGELRDAIYALEERRD